MASSTHVSQFEGMVAGFESELLCIKKRICCNPTEGGQQETARRAVDALKGPLEALEEAALPFRGD